ncbi:phage holin family protein [Bacteroides sp.]|uniref:phage holin family protein n=1 Tax=Bacteroides sp. TaxID=29523 RepID=UPI002FCAA1F5
MIEHFKTLFIGMLTGIWAYLNPVGGDIKSLIAVFVLNFLFGLFAGLLANNESFNLRKAFRCVIEAAAFFLLICAVYFAGDHKGNPGGALQCVSFITYSVFYFYGVNILRNMKQVLSPTGAAYKVVAFLYYVLSVEFIKNIPYLSNYQTKQNETN